MAPVISMSPSYGPSAGTPGISTTLKVAPASAQVCSSHPAPRRPCRRTDGVRVGRDQWIVGRGHGHGQECRDRHRCDDKPGETASQAHSPARESFMCNSPSAIGGPQAWMMIAPLVEPPNEALAARATEELHIRSTRSSTFFAVDVTGPNRTAQAPWIAVQVAPKWSCRRRYQCPRTCPATMRSVASGALRGVRLPVISPTVRSLVRGAVDDAWSRATAAGALPPLPADAPRPLVEVERPADAGFGDFASNLAMRLAKPSRMPPLPSRKPWPPS